MASEITTTISLENVANQNVHLHLRNTTIYNCPVHKGQRQVEMKSGRDKEHHEEHCMGSEYRTVHESDGTGEEEVTLGAIFSKTLSLADTGTEDEKELRYAANTFAKFLNRGDLKQKRESGNEIEDNVYAKRHLTFVAGDDSLWNKAVKGVVRSVNTMADASSMRACSITIGDVVQSDTLDTVQTPSQSAAAECQYASSSTIAESLPHESAQNPVLGRRMTAPIHTIRVAKDPMMTIHPLLLPPGDKFILAHRLASLYLTAILDPWDIPEFKAKYVYTDGRCSSILLTLKYFYEGDRLKELWDATDRASSCAPELAHVSLYRGNISAQPTDSSIRNAAAKELASYRLMQSSLF